MNKKGIFFTFIAVTIVAALIIIFTPSGSVVSIGADMPVVKTRVNTVNDFVLDLENSYFESILKVSSHKAILALISYVADTSNEPFDDLDKLQEVFSDVVLNGKILGATQPIMDGNTINDWLGNMVDISKDTLNVDSVFEVNSVEISQLRPWFVELTLDISFSVTSETASWNVSNFIVNTELSIQNFNDPYYLANTDGDYENKINKTDTEYDEWDVEKVKEHIKHGTYVHFPNSQAPNFLMRFTDSISPSSCCGIESLVNPNILEGLPPPATSNVDLSYADYLFFPSWDEPPSCDDVVLSTEDDIDSEFPDIKFDILHLSLYKLLDDPLADIQQICPQT